MLLDSQSIFIGVSIVFVKSAENSLYFYIKNRNYNYYLQIVSQMAGTIISKELLSEQHNLVLTKQLLKSDTLIKPGKLEKIPEKMDLVMLKLVNLEVFKVYLQSCLNCMELKQLIFKFLSPTLEPHQMILKIANRRIKDDQILGSIVSLNSLIVQEKLPLKEMANSEYYSKIQDDFTLEKGVVKMKCGHLMGRQSIIEFMKALIKDKKYKILCPHPGCLAEWDFEECRQVGCFTNEQRREYKQGLLRNFNELNSIECPGCSTFVVRMDKRVKKLICPNTKCKFKTFCAVCLKKWQDLSQNSCPNVSCSFASEFFNETKTKAFSFYDPVAVKYFSLQIPTHRLCPNCLVSIEHGQGCKHITCTNCHTKFCFVCLDVFEKVWKCGGFNHYCGRIAERQKLI